MQPIPIDREPDSSSSDEAEEQSLATGSANNNSMCIRFDFGDQLKAGIIYNSLSVDKEPKRSKTKKQLEMDGSVIVANLSSDDQKSLMRSANNFADMCHMARSCIDGISKYQFRESKQAADRKVKSDKQRKATDH